MPIKVIELHHHGIRIDPSDEAQEKAKEFYSDLLGLEADEGRPDIPGIPVSGCTSATTSNAPRFI